MFWRLFEEHNYIVYVHFVLGSSWATEIHVYNGCRSHMLKHVKCNKRNIECVIVCNRVHQCIEGWLYVQIAHVYFHTLFWVHLCRHVTYPKRTESYTTEEVFPYWHCHTSYSHDNLLQTPLFQLLLDCDCDNQERMLSEPHPPQQVVSPCMDAWRERVYNEWREIMWDDI